MLHCPDLYYVLRRIRHLLQGSKADSSKGSSSLYRWHSYYRRTDRPVLLLCGGNEPAGRTSCRGRLKFYGRGFRIFHSPLQEAESEGRHRLSSGSGKRQQRSICLYADNYHSELDGRRRRKYCPSRRGRSRPGTALRRRSGTAGRKSSEKCRTGSRRNRHHSHDCFCTVLLRRSGADRRKRLSERISLRIYRRKCPL